MTVKHKLFSTKRRIAAVVGAGALVLAAAGIAAAFFGVTGSGSGKAKTGTAANAKNESVGAGYTSIIPAASGQDPYVEDQALNAGYTEIGDQVTLHKSGYQQLTSVTIAFRNWGIGVTTLPVTVHFSTGVSGPFTVTGKVDIPAAATPGAVPTLTVATLTVAKTGIFVSTTFVYGVTFTRTRATSLNIALSNQKNDLTVGTSPAGALWILNTNASFNTNFPACTGTNPGTGNTHFVSGTFSEVTTACGPAREYKAYGNTGPTVNGNIPAVAFNVVGEAAGPLYPGAPASPVDYAVTNPGPSAAHLTTVNTAIGTLPGGCTSAWFQVYGTQPHTVNRTFPAGTTVVTNTGTTIAMLTSGTTQDGCANKAIPLTFTGSH